MGDTWLQFIIRYYMFALVFVVFNVEMVFRYPHAMSFDVLGLNLQNRNFEWLILVVDIFYTWRKEIFEWS